MLTKLARTLCAVAAAFYATGASAQQSLEIIEAAYGAGNFQMNVTPTVRGLVRDNALDVAVDPAILGGDPAPGQAKRLRVRYRVNGREMESSAGDFERLRLPAPAAAAQPQPAQPNPNWAAGAINQPQPAPAKPGGFSMGDLFGDGPQLRIVSARYGADTRFNDVRDRLQSMVKDNALSVKVDNAPLGGDPAVAKNKVLEVSYEYKGATYQITAKEGATLNLPDPNARLVSGTPAAAAPAAPVAQQGLRILAARYGGDNRFNDVRERLQSLVRDNAVSVKVDNAAMGGDPAVGKDKIIEVQYEFAGKVYRTSAREGRTLNLPDSGAQLVGEAISSSASGTVTPQPAPVRGPDLGASRSAGNRQSVAASGAAPVASAGAVAPLGNAGGLRIFYARYGVAGNEVDVRERLRPLLQNDSLRATVNAGTLGDPAPGVAKTVTIIYEFKGRTYEKVAQDGEAIQLP